MSRNSGMSGTEELTMMLLQLFCIFALASLVAGLLGLSFLMDTFLMSAVTSVAVSIVTATILILE